MVGEGNWTCKKEVLVWQIETEVGTVALPERKDLELLQLLAIPSTQRQMGRKELERLVRKLRSIYLVVPGAAANLYHIQRALTQGGKYRAWLLVDLHREIGDWSELVAQTDAITTHLAEIVRREPTHLGFCDTSGIRAGGVWLNLSGSGKSLVWQHPWPPEIIKVLILDRNPEGTLTNSYLELATLILHEATLLDTCPEATMDTPRLVSDNMPTISWSTREV